MTPRNGRLDDDTRDRILLQMQADLARLLRRVEDAIVPSGRRPAADDALAAAIDHAVGQIPFTAAELMQRAKRDRPLADALAAARATTAMALSRRLRVLARHPHRWRVEQVSREAAGVLWAVEKADDA
jgi:hypothetical protein